MPSYSGRMNELTGWQTLSRCLSKDTLSLQERRRNLRNPRLQNSRPTRCCGRGATSSPRPGHLRLWQRYLHHRLLHVDTTCESISTSLFFLSPSSHGTSCAILYIFDSVHARDILPLSFSCRGPEPKTHCVLLHHSTFLYRSRGTRALLTAIYPSTSTSHICGLLFGMDTFRGHSGSLYLS